MKRAYAPSVGIFCKGMSTRNLKKKQYPPLVMPGRQWKRMLTNKKESSGKVEMQTLRKAEDAAIWVSFVDTLTHQPFPHMYKQFGGLIFIKHFILAHATFNCQNADADASSTVGAYQYNNMSAYWIGADILCVALRWKNNTEMWNVSLWVDVFRIICSAKL